MNYKSVEGEKMHSHLESNIPELVALVYRIGTGCRQYAFSTVDKLESWAGRYPYRDENLLVIVFNEGVQVGRGTMPANQAAIFVSRCLVPF